jgi:hypothetical protein
LAPNRADLSSEAICKARHQVVSTKTDSNVASGSFAAIADCPENAGFSCERHNELWDIARKLFI